MSIGPHFLFYFEVYQCTVFLNYCFNVFFRNFCKLLYFLEDNPRQSSILFQFIPISLYFLGSEPIKFSCSRPYRYVSLQFHHFNHFPAVWSTYARPWRYLAGTEGLTGYQSWMLFVRSQEAFYRILLGKILRR